MSAYETLAYSPMANGAMHRSIEINVPNSGKEKQNRKTNETLNVTSAIFLFGIFEIACLFIFTGWVSLRPEQQQPIQKLYIYV